MSLHLATNEVDGCRSQTVNALKASDTFDIFTIKATLVVFKGQDPR